MKEETKAKIAKYLERYHDYPKPLRKGKYIFIICMLILTVARWAIFYVAVNFDSFAMAFKEFMGYGPNNETIYQWSFANFEKFWAEMTYTGWASQSFKAALKNTLFLFVAGKTYAEAAFLDGAGHFRVFFHIMLPQAMGVLLALWTMQFIDCWNDYMTPIMYLPDYTPITTGLYIYQKETERVLNVPILFAGSLMVLVVPVVMFACFQDKFMNLSFGGGIKG